MSYHHLNRDHHNTNPSNGYQPDLQDDQVSLPSRSPSRERIQSDQNSFGSFLQDSFYPSNQPSLNQTSVGDYEDISVSRDAAISPSHALESDLGDVKGRRRSTIPRKPIASPSKKESTTFLTSDIELFPLPGEDHHLQKSHDLSFKEWRPFMLRKGPATLLIAACLCLVVVLEVFRWQGTKRQGFSTESKDLVQFIRYFPTIIVICLGFAWKSLVFDLKLITPYSAMSRKPTSSDKSVWLNYVDSIEFVSFLNSARNQHWAMFLGLTTGLLCGVLVPLANALTFLNLNFPVHHDIQTNLTSQFSFDNTLSDNNGTLTMPWDYNGGRPYAAVASARLDNGKNSPWTVDNYAFESVDIAPWNSQNATVSVKVQAFNAGLDCKIVRYSTNATAEYPRLRANKEDLIAAGCNMKSPLDLSITQTIENSMLGWINVTDCSENGSDIRMLATVLTGELESRKILNPTMTGVICTPIYTQQDAEIQVNGTTGDIIDFSFFDTKPMTIEAIASLPVVVTYLNNPLDENSQFAHLVYRGGTYNFKRPQATFTNVTLYAGEYKNRDVFFDGLFSIGRTGSDYVKNPALLQREVAAYASTIMTQVVNSLARKITSIPTSGSVTLFERRLLIRESVLRAMQAILIFMGVVCGLCCTFMRPKTKLSEDPGSIAAVSVILSRSRQDVEHEFQDKTAVDIGKGWVLSQSQVGGSALECEAIPTSKKQENRALNPKVGSEDATEPTGFKPLAFRWVARAMLILFVLSSIVCLAVLLHFSISTGGFVTHSTVSSSAWSIVPSAILVLLGYCLASVHGVLESFTPYLTLRSKSGTSTLQRESHASVFYMPVKAIIHFGSIVLATSSLIALLFPVVKVLAAGLYVPEISSKASPIQISRLDTSLMDNFDDMYDFFKTTRRVGENEARNQELEMMVKRASQSAEWTSIPKFGYPHRGGAMDNLVFADFSNATIPDSNNLADHIDVNIPAIAAKVSCVSLGPEHFETWVEDGSSPGSKEWSFDFWQRCATARCNETIGTSISGKIWQKSSSNSTLITKNRYQGKAIVLGNNYTSPLSAFDTPYNLWISDFPSISEQFVNKTLRPKGLTKVLPGQFNMSSFPQTVAVQCNKELWEVTVGVQLSRASKSGLDGTTILPWAVSQIDPKTIQLVRQYANATPIWAYPQNTVWSQYNNEADSVLNGNLLWPPVSRATNIFELIAAYQEFQAGNLTGLMDHVQLAKAVESAYTSYLVEIITEMRPYTSMNATTPRQALGTLYTPLTRMKQDTRTTIALCILLSLMLIGLLYIFVKFPRESLMANPPTSIAAQMSLLAGSKLVQRLRDEDVRSVGETDIWRKRFRLGWWPVNGESGWRWGIDVVEEVGDVGDERFVR